MPSSDKTGPPRCRWTHGGVKIRRSALGGYSADGYIEDLNSVVFLIMIEKNIAVDNIDEILTAAKAKRG